MNLTREFYIPTGATKIAAKDSDAVVYLYRTKSDKPAAVAFVGKAVKPLWRYSFISEAGRERRVAELIDGRRKTLELKAQQKAERNKPHNLQVGHVLETSWGYEQTNVEFFEITRVISDRMVEVREIAQTVTRNDGWAQGQCVPMIGEYVDEPMRRRVSWGDSVKIDKVRTARLWNGTPVRWSAYH